MAPAWSSPYAMAQSPPTLLRDSCDVILRMAKAGEVALALPAFSAAEARATWQRRAKERKAFHGELRRHVREISRSEMFRYVNEQSKDVVAAFIAGAEESRDRLESAIESI